MVQRVLVDQAPADAVVCYGFLCVACAVAVLGCGERGVQAGNGSHHRQFTAARALVISGKYQQAIPALTEFATKFPTSKQASRAGLFLFKANLALGDFEEATRWCEWTIQQYPNRLEAHKCQYKLGVLAMLQDDRKQALRCFTGLADRPDGPLAAESTAMVRFLSRHSDEAP